MNKWIRKMCTTLGVMLTALSVNVLPCQAVNYSVQVNLEVKAEMKADQRTVDVIWVHKTIDGKCYKRLWDDNSKQWLTDWIPCE